MGREDQGVAVSRHRYQVIPRTLCFVTHGEEVLLLLGGAKKASVGRPLQRAGRPRRAGRRHLHVRLPRGARGSRAERA